MLRSVILGFFALLLLSGSAPVGHAQAPVTAGAPFAFASTAVGATAATHVVSFTFGSSGTLAATPYVVLTKGAPNLDFRAAGTQAANACVSAHTYNVGDTCSVTTAFSPTVGGLRLGAVQLYGSAGPLATALLSGNGTAPQITFPVPTAITELGSSFAGFKGSPYVSYQGPWGVAVDGAGDVFATVPSAAAVYEIVAVNGVVSASSSIVQVGSGFNNPYGVTVDGAGNVFVADNGTRTVMEIVASNGTVSAASTVVTVGSGFSVPSGVVVDGAGNVFVADYGAQSADEIVAVNGAVSASSTVVRLAGIANYPVGIAIDASENLYVGAQDGTIHEIAAVAGVLSPASPVTLITSSFGTVRGLAVDPAGDLYAVDFNNHTVNEIIAVNGAVSSSSTIISLGSGFGTPRGVAMDGLGNLYIADDTKDVVFRLDLSDPPSLTYATTNVGSTSSDSPQTVTVANIGNSPLLFSVPTSGTNPKTSASFTLSSAGSTACPLISSSSFSAGSLASSGRCTLPISFSPLSGGLITGTTTLTDNHLNAVNTTQSIALSGTGVGGGLSIAPTTQTFPSTAVGSLSLAQTSTLTNSSGSSIYLSTGTLTDSTDFQTFNNCSGLIAPNSTCVVSFNFHPQSTGTLSSTFSMYNLNTPGSPVTVTLSGTATPALTPNPVLTPSALSFGNVLTGTTGAAMTATLNNTGTGALSISSINIGGTNPASFAQTNTCGTGLAAGGACTIAVTCSPAATGTLSANLYVNYPSPLAQGFVALTCNGTAPPTAPQAALTPASLTFAATTGTATAAQTLTLANAGNAALPITSVALGGASPTQFTETTTCGTSLAAGASCTISVSFNAATTGTFTGSVIVTDSLGTQTSTLTGTATAPVTPSDFAVSATPAAQSTYYGTTVSYTLSIAPLSGANPFTSAVTLTATGLPSGATAAFAPATVIPGTGGATSTLSIKIPPLTGALSRPAQPPNSMVAGGLALATLLFGFCSKRRRTLRVRLLALLLAFGLGSALAGLAGCSSGNGFAIPTASNTITITATSGTTIHATTVTLNLR